MRNILLAVSHSAWLREQATRRAFVKRAVSRFMPGETLEEGIAAATTLRDEGLASILTYLGENVSDAAEADAVVAHYLEVLEKLVAARLDAEISVKPTQLGLDLGLDLAMRNTCRIVEKAKSCGGRRLWIDMESTPYVDATLEMYQKLRAVDANVGVALQCYLYRTREDLERLIPLGGAVRLVKGAYKEPPTLAFPKKQDVDHNFFVLAERLFSPDARAAGMETIIGTHDPVLLDKVAALAERRGVGKRDFEFAMLYGIRKEDQLRLAREGYRSRVLVSYGQYWFPWYMRRLAERPANLWFVAKNILGGKRA